MTELGAKPVLEPEAQAFADATADHPYLFELGPADETDRAQISASPLRATTEQPTGLPPALVIAAEADVLRAAPHPCGRGRNPPGRGLPAHRVPDGVSDNCPLSGGGGPPPLALVYGMR